MTNIQRAAGSAKDIDVKHLNLGEENNVVFAVNLGTLGTGGVGEVEFFYLFILFFHVFLHFLDPFAYILEGPFKNAG